MRGVIAPRWRKVIRDIGGTPLRTSLAVAAMAAGAFGVSMILTSYSILTRELKATYSDTQPASAILILDTPVTDSVVDAARRVPGVADAEGRAVIYGRVRVGKDQWTPLILFVVRDFRGLRMDRFVADSGRWPPGDDEVLIERASLSVTRANVGDRVMVRTVDRGERPIRIAGTVHAAGLAPGWMEHAASGFVTWSSVLRGNTSVESQQLRIVVNGDRLDERHIREVANRVGSAVGKVTRIDIPTPGRHPHAAQMDTFLFLLGAFGALTFALSAVLVANMIHALLVEQVRQAAVMKTIGASTRQIASLYLGQVSILAIMALAIGIPLGISAGRAYARFCASMLNATITNEMPPLWIIACQVAAGIAVPLLVAFAPVWRVSRISIHDAFTNGVGLCAFGTRPFDRWLARMQWLPRPLMFSLRRAFHRRGRLLLTVGTLAAGGAAFIAALNVSAAWTRTLDADARARRFDVQAGFSRAYPIADVARALAAVPDVAHAEYWAETSAMMGDDRVSLVGPDTNSKLLDLPLLEGRWLKPDDDGVCVVNQSIGARRELVLRINDRTVRWRIAGVAKELVPGRTVYAPRRSILAASGQSGALTRSVRVVTRGHDIPAQVAASKAIERALDRAGISVGGIQALSDSRKSFADHLVIIKSALIFAALLVVLVGGLGLTTTLSLNVLERTREIGILSAIGATPRTIARGVVIEGIVMASLSWCVAVIVAIPITFALDAATGNMFVRSPLDFFMSPAAIAGWLLLAVILAAVSSYHPARRAARLAIKEALAYE
ncbi:MAG TPA: FtsX-like permease family protein [Thermoanaerobaculia bacterium]|nr:FtsX-like permease family protein [Thermoanaerobaculia bacterium]